MPYFLNIKDLEMNEDNMNTTVNLGGQHTQTVTTGFDTASEQRGYDFGMAQAKVLKLLNEEGPQYKYNEDVSLKKITDYVNSTYGQHYVGNGDVQTVDFWESLGSLETTARDTAIKYLARYGKKGGKNEKDLLKAIHYIILMMYAAKAGETNPERYGDDR